MYKHVCICVIMSVCLFYAKCASCQRWIIRVGIWALGNELHAVRWGMNPPSALIVLTCKHVTTHVCFTILVRTCSLVLSLILSKTEVLSNILLSLKNKQIVHGKIQTSGKTQSIWQLLLSFVWVWGYYSSRLWDYVGKNPCEEQKKGTY